MSADLGVWYSDVKMGREEAAEFYRHINEDWVVVRRHPSFDAFWVELMEKYPDLCSPDDPPADFDAVPGSLLMTPSDLTQRTISDEEFLEALRDREPIPEDLPWAATLSPNGCAVALPMLWDRVEEVAPEIFALARKHGLVIYNPQDGFVWQPPDLPKPAGAALLLRLQIADAVPDLTATIRLGEETLFEGGIASREEAHRRARDLALARDLPHYQVEDPGCLGSCIDWEPISSGPDFEVSQMRVRDSEA